MRSISGTLEAAEKATELVPYIHMLFTNKGGGTTHDYSTDQKGRRVTHLQHIEEPYNEYAIIRLRNNDQTIPDLRGFWTEIGYGAVTGGGNEYIGDGTSEPGPARVWCIRQHTWYQHGAFHSILEMEGMWNWLGDSLLRLGSPPLYIQDEENDPGNFELGSKTIEGIIDYILSKQIPAMAIAAGSPSDGVIDVLEPSIHINNTQYFEDAREIIRRLIEMTACYIRPIADLEMEVVYPQTTDPFDATYYMKTAGQRHYWRYDDQKNVVKPNHIVCFGNADTSTGQWNPDTIITAEATDAESVGFIGDVYFITLAPDLTTYEDCYNRANAVLTRWKTEQPGGSGKLLMPHDCRIQLYDRVSMVVDV